MNLLIQLLGTTVVIFTLLDSLFCFLRVGTVPSVNRLPGLCGTSSNCSVR